MQGTWSGDNVICNAGYMVAICNAGHVVWGQCYKAGHVVWLYVMQGTWSGDNAIRMYIRTYTANYFIMYISTSRSTL